MEIMYKIKYLLFVRKHIIYQFPLQFAVTFVLIMDHHGKIHALYMFS